MDEMKAEPLSPSTPKSQSLVESTDSTGAQPPSPTSSTSSTPTKGRRASYKRRRREEDVTLEGFVFKETEDEGMIEVYEREVKKGIKAKHAKCVAPMLSPKGETMGVCGKIFGRVPNCKRHLHSIHQKQQQQGGGQPTKPRRPPKKRSKHSDGTESGQKTSQTEQQQQQHLPGVSGESPISELTESPTTSSSPHSHLNDHSPLVHDEEAPQLKAATVVDLMPLPTKQKSNDPENVWIHMNEEKNTTQKDFDHLYDELFHTDKES